MPDEIFEAIYTTADGDERQVPWQDSMGRRYMSEWLAAANLSRYRRALVVAAGLGDDAAQLAQAGLEVVAFDYAPTAVEWAQRRHPDAKVEWHVADLFAPPAEWRGAFDLVVEVFTVQSIPPPRQPEAAAAIADFVSPGGTAVAVALAHDGAIEPGGPPWPLHPSTIDRLAAGMVEQSRFAETVAPGITALRVEWGRPL